MPFATFREVIATHAALRPQAPFVLAPEPNAILTWDALQRGVDAFAAVMERHRVAPGDIVGFMLPNGLSALTTFLWAMAGG